MNWSFEVVPSVREFSPDEWDALAAPAGYYASWSWTAFVETETGRQCAYVAARDDQGLAAVLPLWFTTAEENEFRTPAMLIGDLGVTDVRYAVMCFQRAYRSEVLSRAGVDLLPVLEKLAAVASDHASAQGAAGVLALYADTATMLRLTAALGQQRAILLEGCAGITVPAGGMAEFLDRFSHQRRGQIRREMRRFVDAGYSAGVESLASCVTEFAPLAAQLESRYGHSGDVDDLRASLVRQAEASDEQTAVFTARHEGRLVAACLAYRSRPELLVRMFGKDYERENHAEYFNLLVYQPLRYAIEHEFGWVELGHTTAAAKVARGAVFRALWAVDLTEKPLWTIEQGRVHSAGQFERLSAEATALRTVGRSELWSDIGPDLVELVERPHRATTR